MILGGGFGGGGGLGGKGPGAESKLKTIGERDFEAEVFRATEPVLIYFSSQRAGQASQIPKRLPLAGDAELHSAADKASAAYRRYLLREGVRFGVLP